ncbi:MAG: hypothetical protein HKN43_13730 [Rhodothermales bacterium]|nr:hypothetical protein [Rhodothermales bacterium]
MRNIVLASLLSAFALMIFGFIVWATPISSPAFGSGLDVEAVQEALRNAAPESGTYALPDPYVEDQEGFFRAHERGPIGILHIMKEGEPAMAPSTFIFGFIHNFVTAMLLAILLQMALPALPSYAGRVLFCTMCGVFAAVWENFTAPIWFLTPWSFFVVRSLYTIVGMTLIGAILAKFIKQ